MLHLQAPITIQELPSVSSRHFTVLTQQQLHKHNTLYNHCTVPTDMYKGAHFNYEASSCIHSFCRAACSLCCAAELIWEILSMLKSVHLRMRMNLEILHSLEYRQYISRCLGVYR